MKPFLLALFVFLGIDFVWLGLVAKKFYDQELSAFSRVLKWPPALLAYLLLVLGIVFFVLPKAPGGGWSVFGWGALFGLIAYGVYDLVNLATLANWTLKMTVVDMLWGAAVCGLVSLIASFLLNR